MVSPTTDRRYGLVGSLVFKKAVAALADSNITQYGEQTIDGIAVKAINSYGVPNRVLCNGMTDQSKNGIWDVSLTNWTRSLDADGDYDLEIGSAVLVRAGTVYGGKIYYLATPGHITYGVTPMVWTPIATSGSGSTGTVTTVSVANANGFSGTVATPTTTPVITMRANVNGILLGNGSQISAAIGNDLPVMTATTRGAVPTPPNDATKILSGIGTWITAPIGSGTVTTASVVSANGFAGTVATPTTTPAITITTTATGVLKGNGTAISAALNSDLPVMTATVGGAVPTPPNLTTQFLRGDGTWAVTPGTGTVTTASVVGANGFAGTVSNPTTTPAITLSTSVNGMVKGNGTSISAATDSVDYISPTYGDSRYAILKTSYDIQNIGRTKGINFSGDGAWGCAPGQSSVFWGVTANIKAHTGNQVAPMLNDPVNVIAAFLGETVFDYNSYGGECVGGYFACISHGIPGGAVSNCVGVSGTARTTATGDWISGGHFDTYDYTGGNIIIGVNVELRYTKNTSQIIGVNIQNTENTASNGNAVSIQGDFNSVIHLSNGTLPGNPAYLIDMLSTNAMFVTRAIGTYAGQCLAIKVDGVATRYIPLYLT